MRRASAAARSAMKVVAVASVTVGGCRAGRCCLLAGPWGCTVARMSLARVGGAAGGAGPRGGGVEAVLVVCGTPALVGVVAGAGGGGIRDVVVR